MRNENLFRRKFETKFLKNGEYLQILAVYPPHFDEKSRKIFVNCYIKFCGDIYYKTLVLTKKNLRKLTKFSDSLVFDFNKNLLKGGQV